MSNILEVLVTCDSNNPLWTCSVWDPQTGTSLMSYRGGGTAELKTLSFIGKDYIAAVEKAKPVMHVWPLNSHQTVQGMRFILPGKATAIAFTSDGSFCVAGIDEKIYLWQMSSGNLLTIISRHYQKVVLLKFTPDGKYFVSAAEDGMVMIWSLATVATHPEVELVSQTRAGQHDPVYVFSDHSLPVTDMVISKMGMRGRLVTVSSDRTCKIYDLDIGEMLLNLVFDVPLLSVTMDVLELSVFVGTSEGKIHQFGLTNPPRNRDLLVNTENTQSFTSHSKGVVCLSASIDGETLISGSYDEQVILWHIRSHQPVRTIRHKGPVTNAFFTMNNPAIYKQDFNPSIVLHSLERTLEKDAEHITEIEVLIKNKINFWPQMTGNYETVSNKEVEMEFKKKEEKFQDELEKMKKINASLYSLSIKKVLSSVSDTKVINSNSLSTLASKKRKNKK